MEHIGVEPDGALSHYHGVWHSFQGAFKGADNRSTGHTNTLTQLRLLFEERRTLKVELLKAGLSQEELQAIELNSSLEGKDLQL